MLKIPAIDIIDGKVVRLSKGEFESAVSYNKTPLEQARFIMILDLSGFISLIFLVQGMAK
ncbi:MAG: hypothetical protein IPO41_12990 [Acidobacteria bacterium]|nr:hypothetical protein [Acidobacteriota bacterium]